MRKSIFILPYLLFACGHFASAQSDIQSNAKCASIYQVYEDLCLTLNGPHLPHPTSGPFKMSARIKQENFLEVSEQRGHYFQKFTLPLRDIISFEMKVDSALQETRFIITLKDSIRLESFYDGSKTHVANQPRVSFVLENQFSIQQAENFLNTICRNNHRQALLEEARKDATTF